MCGPDSDPRVVVLPGFGGFDVEPELRIFSRGVVEVTCPVYDRYEPDGDGEVLTAAALREYALGILAALDEVGL